VVAAPLLVVAVMMVVVEWVSRVAAEIAVVEAGGEGREGRGSIRGIGSASNKRACLSAACIRT
jgi:hypothetical protein